MKPMFGNHLSLLQPLILLDFSSLEPRQELSCASPFSYKWFVAEQHICLSELHHESTFVKKSQAHFSHTAVSATHASASSRIAMVPAARRQEIQIKKECTMHKQWRLALRKQGILIYIISQCIYTLPYSKAILHSTQASPDTWYPTVAKQNLFFCKWKGLQH